MSIRWENPSSGRRRADDETASARWCYTSKGRCRSDEKIRRRADEEPMMKQRRPDDVIRCSADADPMSKTIIGPMKLSVIGPMKHPSRARHRADEVVLVGDVLAAAGLLMETPARPPLSMEMNTVALKLPASWPDNPRKWFLYCEGKFRIHKAARWTGTRLVANCNTKL